MSVLSWLINAVSFFVHDTCRAQKKPVGILYVNVVQAFKLSKKDLMGKSDPYVKLKLTEDKLPSKKTSVKRSNLNPEWNEEFKLVVKDPESQALELIVYDWEQVNIIFPISSAFSTYQRLACSNQYDYILPY